MIFIIIWIYKKVRKLSKKDCIFCNIVRGKIPSKKIEENDHAMSFLDINPISPGHSVIISKDHYETLEEIPDEELCEVYKMVRSVAKIVRDNLQMDGYNIIQNNHKAAGQEINHFHVHVIPRDYRDKRITLNPPRKETSERELDEILSKLKD